MAMKKRPEGMLEFFQRDLEKFVARVEATVQSFPVVANLLKRESRETVDEFEGWLMAVQDAAARSRTAALETGRKAIVLSRKMLAAGFVKERMPRLFLVLLVSLFEAHVAGMLESAYETQQDVTEKQLLELLNKPTWERVRWLIGKAGLKSQYASELKSQLVEITERRNAIVHHGGRVSRQYREACGKRGGKVEIGTELNVTENYVLKASECLLEVGVRLGYTLWKRLVPSQASLADDQLLEICWAFVERGRPALGITIAEFQRRNCGTEVKPFLDILLAHAYKMTGKAKSFRDAIARIPWESLHPQLQLVRAVFDADYPRAAQVMKESGNDGPIQLHAYREWSLFDEFRETVPFLEAFEQVYGEPFSWINSATSLKARRNDLN